VAAGMSIKRNAFYDEMMIATAKIMNDRGIDALSLGELATYMGKARNSLYHYVKDKNELIWSCLCYSCEQRELILEQAESHPTAQKQLLRYIELVLHQREAVLATTSDYAILTEPYRSEIELRLNSNNQRLGQIILNGQNTGEFKTCDANVVAHALNSILEWSMVWENWSSPQKPHSKEALFDIISDWIVHGIAQDSQISTPFPHDSSDLTHFEYNPFKKEDAEKQKRQIIIEVASRLFNRYGFGATSMEQIGRSLGTSKGTIYSRFADKTTLIHDCYTEALNKYEAFIKVACDNSDNNFDKLLSVFHLNCQAQASDKPPLILLSGFEQLPRKHIIRLDGIVTKLSSIHSQALKQKSVKPTDIRIILLCSGAFFGLQRWRQYHPERSKRDIANELTTIFATGLKLE